MTVDVRALGRLSFRAGHHAPDAAPFIAPAADIFDEMGFEVDPRNSVMRLRRNGRLYLLRHERVAGRSFVSVREYRHRSPSVEVMRVDVTELNKTLRRSATTAAYDAVRDQIRALALQLRAHADAQP